MLDHVKISELTRESAEKGWTYPQLFDALKNIGVERYEVNVLKHEIKYVGGGTSLSAPPPKEFHPLTAGKKFDEAGLKLALARVQRRETNYEQFLAEIAAAGVGFYRVDMQPRTVTYHGPTPKEKLVEKVPNKNA
jgi:uncharacterized protein YbcV (DUF1398 family)